jgi:5'-methylthioadenosine phosphorylase/5'-methylthioinosine phosphorylase
VVKVVAKVAVIGGSGFYEFPDLAAVSTVDIDTPYQAAVKVTVGRIKGTSVAFVPRHGPEHRIPPHLINYRANIWALKSLGVDVVFALNAVGGIAADMGPGALVIPDQIIDYTFAREHTYADVLSDTLNHVDFTEPFSQKLRSVLLNAAHGLGLKVITPAVYGCTQGPRLESAAEVRRYRRDGCDLLGMTGMPEAALARELDMQYASLCTVVNWAAGLTGAPITLGEIYQTLSLVRPHLRSLLVSSIASLA